MGASTTVQQRASRMIKRLELLSDERLRELRLINLEKKEGSVGNLIMFINT